MPGGKALGAADDGADKTGGAMTVVPGKGTCCPGICGLYGGAVPYGVLA
jgi:hypothetical protein